MVPTEHLGNRLLGVRHEGHLYICGQVSDEQYTFREGDVFLPLIGGGVVVPEGLQQAIISLEFAGRIVPHHMVEYIRVLDDGTTE